MFIKWFIEFDSKVNPLSTRFSDHQNVDLNSPFITNTSSIKNKQKLIGNSNLNHNKVRTAGNSPAVSPGMFCCVVKFDLVSKNRTLK